MRNSSWKKWTAGKILWLGWLLACVWGFGLAGGLSAADNPAPKDPVVARINHHAIHLSEVYAAMRALPLGDQIDVRESLGKFTESVITEELLFQWTLGSDFAADPALRREVKELVVRRMIQQEVKERIRVSEQEIRAYYAQHRDVVRGLHVRVRQILLKERKACEELLKRIGGEQDFAVLARNLSRDTTSAASGGDIGYLMPQPNPQWAGFEMALFQMAVGEMRVFDSHQGCHLVRVTEKIDPPDPPYQEIARQLRPFLERQQEQALLQALIGKASRKVLVERPPAGK